VVEKPLWSLSRQRLSAGAQTVCFGSDRMKTILTAVGGSLRIPAHYSGICGLKPVKGRWPSAMGRKPIPGFEAVRVCS
jgi:hypothetical protein